MRSIFRLVMLAGVLLGLFALAPASVSGQTLTLPPNIHLNQSRLEFDLNSAGSARVTYMMFLENSSNSSLTMLNITFPQGTFGIFAIDLVVSHALNFLIAQSNSENFTVTFFLDSPLVPKARTIVQVSLNQSNLAGFANRPEQLQGIWTLTLELPSIPNSGLSVRLPLGTQPLTISENPSGVGVTEQYLDTDGRWIIALAAGLMPPNFVFQVKYELALKLWGFVFAPLITFGCVYYVNHVVRTKAARHAKELRDRFGAYTLWQISLTMHLALLAVVVGSWGLILGQEPIFPSPIDYAMGVLLTVSLVTLMSDSASHERFIHSIKPPAIT